MRICTVDIETEFIPSTGIFDIRKIHCIGVKIDDEPTLCFTSVYTPNSDGNLQTAIKLINTCDYIVGHNLAKFDRPVLEANFGKLKPTTVDTLIDASLMYTSDQLMSMDAGIQDMPKDLWGRFSLKAFGYRFGDYKLDFEEFDKLSTDMVTYCKQDVELTYRLYKFLSAKQDYPLKQVRELEYDVAEIIAVQEYVGFYVDIVKARELFLSMKFKASSIKQQLLRVFRPKFLPDGEPVTPAKPRRQKLYRPNPNYQFKSRVPFRRISQLDRAKNGKWKLPAKNKYKYFTTPHSIYFSYYTGEYQKIKLEKFDPGSRHKIRKWLAEDFGYEFPFYTPKGNPKVDADSLDNLEIPEGKLLKDYLKLVKDLSQLESGTGSILKNIRKDSTVPSSRETPKALPLIE